MALDTSIAVSIKDNFSSGIVKMKKNLTDFEKQIADTGTKIDQLNRRKASISVDVQKAKKELQEARAAFDKTDESAKRLSDAEYNYSNLTAELKSITSEANAANKALNNLRDQQAKAENRASGGTIAGGYGGGISAGETSILSRLGQAGATQMVGEVVSQIAGAYISSAFDSETANVLNSALSYGASGAAIGTAIAPGIGTAIGAAGGAILGGISGAVGNFEDQDAYFKSLVQETYDKYNEEQANALSNGLTIASNRQQSQLQFTTLLGSSDAAAEWVDWMKDYSAYTPFTYDELANLSKVGLAYDFNTDEVKGMMQAIGDAGSALGIQGTDLQEVAAQIGRMNSTGKVTLEYLNPLIERGIDAMQYLADSMTEASGGEKIYTKADVSEAISLGELNGADAARAIMGAMAEQFAGSMDLLAETYAGKMSTLEDAQGNLDAAMGAGYMEERNKGLDAQINFLDSEAGKKMEEAYSLMGEYQAFLENEKERILQEYITEAMNSEEMKTAKLAGDIDTVGKLLTEAKVNAEAEYAQTAGKEYQDQQIEIVNTIQEGLVPVYENMGYTLGKAMERGIESVRGEIEESAKLTAQAKAESIWYDTMQKMKAGGSDYTPDIWGSSLAAGTGTGNAAGLSYVPYNDYITRLHEGERVLTAEENRRYSQGNNGQIVISGNNITVREEADIDKIAAKLAEEIEQRRRLAW